MRESITQGRLGQKQGPPEGKQPAPGDHARPEAPSASTREQGEGGGQARGLQPLGPRPQASQPVVMAGWGHLCFPACPLLAGSPRATGGAGDRVEEGLVPAGAEGGISSRAVRVTQQEPSACSSTRWDAGEELPVLGQPHSRRSQRALGSCGGVVRHGFSGCPLHQETSARRSQNSSSCWKLQGFGLNPPDSKTARPALNLAAARWEQPSRAAELRHSRWLVLVSVFQQSQSGFGSCRSCSHHSPLPTGSLGWWNRDGDTDLSSREPGTAHVPQEALARGIISFLCQSPL